MNRDARSLSHADIDVARTAIGTEKLELRRKHWDDRTHDLRHGPHRGYLKVLNVRLDELNKEQELRAGPKPKR